MLKNHGKTSRNFALILICVMVFSLAQVETVFALKTLTVTDLTVPQATNNLFFDYTYVSSTSNGTTYTITAETNDRIKMTSAVNHKEMFLSVDLEALKDAANISSVVLRMYCTTTSDNDTLSVFEYDYIDPTNKGTLIPFVQGSRTAIGTATRITGQAIGLADYDITDGIKNIIATENASSTPNYKRSLVIMDTAVDGNGMFHTGCIGLATHESYVRPYIAVSYDATAQTAALSELNAVTGNAGSTTEQIGAVLTANAKTLGIDLSVLLSPETIYPQFANQTFATVADVKAKFDDVVSSKLAIEALPLDDSYNLFYNSINTATGASTYSLDMDRTTKMSFVLKDLSAITDVDKITKVTLTLSGKYMSTTKPSNNVNYWVRKYADYQTVVTPSGTVATDANYLYYFPLANTFGNNTIGGLNISADASTNTSDSLDVTEYFKEQLTGNKKFNISLSVAGSLYGSLWNRGSAAVPIPNPENAATITIIRDNSASTPQTDGYTFTVNSASSSIQTIESESVLNVASINVSKNEAYAGNTTIILAAYENGTLKGVSLVDGTSSLDAIGQGGSSDITINENFEATTDTIKVMFWSDFTSTLSPLSIVKSIQLIIR